MCVLLRKSSAFHAQNGDLEIFDPFYSQSYVKAIGMVFKCVYTHIGVVRYVICTYKQLLGTSYGYIMPIYIRIKH